MYLRILFFICFILSDYCFSQSQFEKIELNYSNSMIIGSGINIIIEPLKIKSKKMRIIVKSKDKNSTRRISKKEYTRINDAVLKIDPKKLYNIIDNSKDTIQTNCLDGVSATITIFKNSKKGSYSLDCLSKMDKYNNHRKDFWYATKLIFKAGKVKIKELEY